MNMDDLQNLWREQRLPPVTDDASLSARLADVKKQARAFDRAILMRDARETIAAVFVSWSFGHRAWVRAAEGHASALAWLAAGLPLAVVAFLFVDRWRHRHLAARPGDAVLVEIERAIGRFHHQVWLLRNVAWWYLAPLAASAVIVTGQSLAAMRGGWAPKLIVGSIMFGLLTVVFGKIWRLNDRAVVTSLKPQIEALQRQRALLAADEPTASLPPTL